MSRPIRAVLAFGLMLALVGCTGQAGASPAGTAPGGASDAPASVPATLDEVTLQLDYLMDGNKAPFVLGKELGFFEEQGIDLTIAEGTGSVDAANAVGARTVPFALSSTTATANAVNAGVPIVMVANHQPLGQDVIFVRQDSPIQDLKDLEGRKLVAGAGSNATIILEPFLQAAGVDVSKVQIDEVAEEGKNLLFLQGQYEATSTPYESIAQMRNAEPDVKLRAFFIADYGFSTMNQGLIVNKELTESNPDLIKRMIAAYAKSYIYGATHQDEVVAAVIKAYPSVTEEVLRTELGIAYSLVSTENTKDHPFGYISPEDWAATLTVMEQIGALDTDLAPEAFFTNAFIGDWEPLLADADLLE